jgi:hypothetical protein
MEGGAIIASGRPQEVQKYIEELNQVLKKEEPEVDD